jgi:hypothetical protein
MALPTGSAKMQEIAKAIQEGANAYLNRQYRTIAIIGAVVAVLVAIFFMNWQAPVGFLIGAILSGAAGYIGMKISVQANVRTTEASSKGLAQGLLRLCEGRQGQRLGGPAAREAQPRLGRGLAARPDLELQGDVGAIFAKPTTEGRGLGAAHQAAGLAQALGVDLGPAPGGGDELGGLLHHRSRGRARGGEGLERHARGRPSGKIVHVHLRPWPEGGRSQPKVRSSEASGRSGAPAEGGAGESRPPPHAGYPTQPLPSTKDADRF